MSEAPLGGPGGSGAVFISHTSELARYPQDRSFVQAAVDAVIAAGRVPVEMVRAELLAAGLADDADLDAHLAAVDAGELDLTYAPLISAWGRRPS